MSAATSFLQSTNLKLLTIKLASSELDKVIILEREDGISLDGTLAAGDLAFLLDIDSKGLLLAFGVLDDELEDTIDLYHMMNDACT